MLGLASTHVATAIDQARDERRRNRPDRDLSQPRLRRVWGVR